MGNIGNKSIHTHYHKLPDETKSNKIEGVISDVFVVVLDPDKFSRGGF